ncbi:hypothetical protein IGS73_07580 [Janibacter indicus]|uniref:Zn-dependent protease with chaperone function n=1 Tax=Janibacter indicus TaxID=857417 RepID=A0A7L9J633_9MICO|nr:hypothetical protein [Janibacter indicus]QOK24210.1 hypothetical protein IGS73_07580 [Janibacter indicus]
MNKSTTKTLATAPAVVISTWLVMMVGPFLPALAAWALILGGLLTMGLLLLGVGESLAARVLLRARRPSAAEDATLAPAVAILCQHQLGPPLVELRIRDGIYAISAGAAGRRTVIVSDGLIAAIREGVLPAEQSAAVIGHSSGLIRSGAVRSDLALSFWTLPWQVVAGFALGVGRFFARLPFVSLLWRGRFIVGAVALVQGLAAGTPATIASGIIGASVIALSYAMPRWEARWQAALVSIGDTQVTHAGLNGPLNEFLGRCPQTPATAERRHHLTHSRQPATAPRLALVTGATS